MVVKQDLQATQWCRRWSLPWLPDEMSPFGKKGVLFLLIFFMSLRCG